MCYYNKIHELLVEGLKRDLRLVKRLKKGKGLPSLDPTPAGAFSKLSDRFAKRIPRQEKALNKNLDVYKGADIDSATGKFKPKSAPKVKSFWSGKTGAGYETPAQMQARYKQNVTLSNIPAQERKKDLKLMKYQKQIPQQIKQGQRYKDKMSKAAEDALKGNWKWKSKP